LEGIYRNQQEGIGKRGEKKGRDQSLPSYIPSWRTKKKKEGKEGIPGIAFQVSYYIRRERRRGRRRREEGGGRVQAFYA